MVEEVDWEEMLRDMEFEEALLISKNRKAAGGDNVNIELYKYLPAQVTYRLVDIVNQRWKQTVTPSDWRKALVVPIFKKASQTCSENYR